MGGDFEEFVPVEEGKESDLHEPDCLPDGSILFPSHTTNGRPDKLMLLVDGKRKQLLETPGQDFWFPVYSPTGHILYRRQPSNAGIWAVPFSLARHEITGEPFMVAPDADVPSVSADGTLVHVKGSGSRMTQLVLTDRDGKVLGPIGPPQEQWPFPQLSPDGRFVAIAAKENEVDDIWIHDIERGTRTRMSAGTVPYAVPVWSPDGKRILYGTGSGDPLTLTLKAADGTGEAKTLGTGWAGAFSADGKTIVFADSDKDTEWDLWYLPADGDGQRVSFLKQPGNQIWPRLSPDGRYLAYVSDEDGTREVYLKRFPGGEGKWQVSVGGGTWPRFSHDGRRLYYVQEDTLMEVDVDAGTELHLGAPRAVFERRALAWRLIFDWPPGFDVSAHEDRFVISQPVGDQPETGGIVVTENWVAEFARPGL